MIPVVYDPSYLDYYFGPAHPFSPVRSEMLLELLEALGHPVEAVRPAPATHEDVLTVHSEAFVEQVEAASAGTPRPDAERFGLGTADVPFFEGMDAAARGLVGGTLHAAKMVAPGEATKVLQLGGGLHHARRDEAAGFCIYNDLSIAIRHLTRQGLRVAYIDVDVHHGDGVQWIHYNEADVLTISLHESGQHLYPGTGGIEELGAGGGKGFKLNVPLAPYTPDESYLEAFEQVAPHALAWFQPDVLVVQCGADAHFRDPLADLHLTTRAYETLFRRLVALADKYAGGRAVFTLGGGYNPDATVRSWALLYLVLQGAPLPDRLPEAWRARWEKHLGSVLTPSLHDATPPSSLPEARHAVIIQRNRQTARRLMETAVLYWH